MQRRNVLAEVLATAMLSSIAVSAYAESAPVFDVDAVQQQFESGDQADYPPPPPPSQEGAFVPMNPAASAASSPRQELATATPSGTTAQRLRKVEQQLANMQNAESPARMDSLQEQVQSLRGQVEQLTHQVETLQSQQKAMYNDLDKRVSGGDQDKNLKRSLDAGVSDNGTETDPTKTNGKSAKISSAKQTVKTIVGASPAAAVAAKTNKSAQQPDDAEEQAIYQTAYNLIKAKKYNEAVDALQGMLKKYPSGQFASNAHYWLGELYGLMGKNDLALTEFTTVISSFPQSPRVSDAQLKIGLIYAAQSKWADAKLSFKKVISAYPGTASARVASEQMKQIKTSGH